MTTRHIERMEDLPSHCVRSLRGIGMEQLRALAKSADQRFVLADLSGCTDKPSALRMLGHAFSLPSWFGANLDALYESLTDEETWQVGRGAGGNPATSGEYYYTDDHYNSFRRILE